MYKAILSLSIVTLLSCVTADAQVRLFFGPSIGYNYGPRYGRPPGQRRPQSNLPKYKPTVNISFGYGFPNLDKYQLPVFYNYYKGSVNAQTGPISGAIDYQFSRSTSIGVMVSYGNVSVPYYGYSNNAAAFTGKLENLSVMINLMNYFPVNNNNIAPYIRTAIGVNTWTQNFTDPSGNKVNVNGSPADLAYQVSLGSKFFFNKNTGLFIEAGYGKYILQGGLCFRF